MTTEPPPRDDRRDPLDAVLAVLSNGRRRSVLRCVRRRDRVTVDELARKVALRSAGSDALRVPEDELATVRATLHHCHLPVLADADLVVFDPDRETVAISTRGARVGAWIEEVVASGPRLDEDCLGDERSAGDAVTGDTGAD